ncbi:ATP-binding cassette domain-containing protein [Paenibacillus thermoaerophilus]|uniref:ATP-binding cassette domain-containing protein n=1 Tax=Paenibacillus thermoaerophilus TaxID=1215385 RepID=A0ABW2V1G2_9BACL|nr:ATP-binding cassette domain-containing protein [Paenibacillus thermoaerophilus]TMV14349.1 ATP-binding cassette domain-containing protein [Paenibacillus thermoaerophilus]
MIRVERVSKTFRTKKETIQANKSISFHVRKGEVVGLLGENGAGKTTLLRMIATLLEPTEGSIRVAGYDTQMQGMEVKRRIGVLFGGETGLYERLTARENLEYFASLYGMSKHETKARIESLAVKFGMKDYLDRRVGGFSKGMKQKVAIARTVIHDPEVILFDEPTTGLDITSANIFRQLIHQLRTEGKTIIFSSHIMEEVSLLCQSVIMIHRGEVIYNGSLAELYEEEGSEDLNYIMMSRMVRGA